MPPCGAPLPERRFPFVAPLYEEKRVAWSYLKRFIENIPGRKPNETELHVEFGGGRRVRSNVWATKEMNNVPHNGAAIQRMPCSRRLAGSGAKSLLGYAHKLGFTPFNAGATIKVRSDSAHRGATLAKRIVSEVEVGP